jgi:radical SAM protein with 4Fe4S-binding SPASM domain
MRHRYECFGGIISIEEPPMLVYVDQDYIRNLGLAESPLWQQPKAHLSAPTEVHCAITNRCSLGCRHCYMDSGARLPDEVSSREFKNLLRHLRDVGVFHIALGGGEAFEHPDLFEIATYARELGLIPNLTTNGLLITEENAKRCRVFGQINVSFDGIGENYQILRGVAAFEPALTGLKRLLAAGIRAGINTVVSRHNFDQLDAIIAFGREQGVNDIELLRIKPAGRGKIGFAEADLRYDQARVLYPKILEWSQNYDLPIKIDCSFVPMMCYHRPDPNLLEKFAVYGCEGGNVLIGVRADGLATPCSFIEPDENALPIANLAERWDQHEPFGQFRTWPDQAAMPCRTCDYLRLCKGGCHAVARYYHGHIFAPDPGCPWVFEFHHAHQESHP